MYMDTLYKELLSKQDLTYRQMQIRLIPNINSHTIIGVRTPELRAMAENMKNKLAFLQDLPHRWFEENQIHSFILGQEKDFSRAVAGVNAFLPYVDNWETCDQLRPISFRKHRQELLAHIQKWLASGQVYSVRFAIGMLMAHYLDESFDPEYLAWVAAVESDAYYVNMMIAWYFATALAKQYEAAYPYISQYRLSKWVHNKTIQKAVESFRISAEQKQRLRELRIK